MHDTTGIMMGCTSAAAATGMWDAAAGNPQARNSILILATIVGVGYVIYWFIDGVRHWRRRCLRCRGRGTFTSPLTQRRDRPCACCGGSGRHATIRRRLVRRGH